ncbi:MAG: MBL fold metallo-hydrolase [Deltaproteobacteria bacterium]|nr:MBL fold metallo-hydrolase [Deltaproteobacteria bacterium]
MKITHYLYNTFVIESGDKKIAIDPGGLFFYFFRFTTVIPKSEWESITHIFVTHGDPDHYWHMDRVAKVSNAPVICNKTMVRNIGGKTLILGPRDKGLAFTTRIEKPHTISVDETIQLDGMSITGIKATHGPVTLKIGPLSKTLKPGPDERVGWGAIGFNIQLNGKSVVNLGDTLLHEKEWQSIKNPDVLMIPIGGRTVHNTMDEKEAIQAIKTMQPKLVIPCHYNSPALFSKELNPADDKMFKEEVEKMGIDCAIFRKGDSIDI